jgi:hypothetical protein
MVIASVVNCIKPVVSTDSCDIVENLGRPE